MRKEQPHFQDRLSVSFWVFVAASLLFTIGFSIYFFLFNLYLAKLHIPESVIGRIVAAMALGSLAGTFPAGLVASRFGIRKTLTTALLLMSSFATGRVFVTTISMQLVLSFALGCVLCTWAVCLPPSIARLTSEERRPAAFSVIFGTGIGAAGIGAWLAGSLPGLFSSVVPTSLLSMKATLVTGALVVATAIVPLAFISLGAADQPFFPKGRPHPFLYRFLPIAFLWGVMTNALPPFIGIYFNQQFGTPLNRIGYLFAVAQFAQCAAVLLAPFVVKKTGQVFLLLSSQMIASVALLALSGTRVPGLAASIYWLYIAMQYVSEPALFSLLVNRLPPDEHHNGSSMNFFVSSLAQSCAAAGIGASISRVGYTGTFTFLAIAASVTGVLLALLLRGAIRTKNPETTLCPE